MMQCSACGADTPAEAVYCAKCGHNLRDDTAGGDAPEAAAKTADPGHPGQQGSSASVAQRFQDSAGPNNDKEEEVSLWKGGYSAKAMVGTWILCAIATVLLIAATVFFPGVWFVLIPLIFVAWILAALMLGYRKMSVSYELTTQRFIHKTGIFKRTSDRLEVLDIDDVTYAQGLIQRMFNVGSIRISSSDRTHPVLQLEGIDDVRMIADTIDDVRRKERRRRGLHIETI